MIGKVLVVVVLGALTVWGGSPLVQLLFRLADRTERKADGTGAALVPPAARSLGTTELALGAAEVPLTPAGSALGTGDPEDVPVQDLGLDAEPVTPADPALGPNGVGTSDPAPLRTSGDAAVSAAPARQPAPPDVGAIQAAETQLRGGLWIGYLERLAIFATIVAGYGAGLVVILGVKSLARYPELTSHENRGAAERFIIGTFASALVAAGGAGLALWLTSLW